jgi:hypothetical protein
MAFQDGCVRAAWENSWNRLDSHQPSLDHRATVSQVPQHVTIAMPVPQGTLPGQLHRSSVTGEEDVPAAGWRLRRKYRGKEAIIQVVSDFSMVNSIPNI